jgi:hypothetical protein
MLKPSLRDLIARGQESYADRSGTYGYLKSRERMMEQQEAKRRGMRLEFYTRRPTTPEDFQNLDILTEQPVRRGATPISDNLAKYEYNLGPNRPNKPSERVISAIQQAVTSALGPGYSFEVISGQENPGHQHLRPMSRYTTRTAFD